MVVWSDCAVAMRTVSKRAACRQVPCAAALGGRRWSEQAVTSGTDSELQPGVVASPRSGEASVQTPKAQTNQRKREGQAVPADQRTSGPADQWG